MVVMDSVSSWEVTYDKLKLKKEDQRFAIDNNTINELVEREGRKSWLQTHVLDIRWLYLALSLSPLALPILFSFFVCLFTNSLLGRYTISFLHMYGNWDSVSSNDFPHDSTSKCSSSDSEMFWFFQSSFDHVIRSVGHPHQVYRLQASSLVHTLKTFPHHYISKNQCLISHCSSGVERGIDIYSLLWYLYTIALYTEPSFSYTF